MKNFIILAIMAALCLLLVACGNASDSNASDDSDNANKQTTVADNNEASAPTPKSDGYTLTVQDTTVAIDAVMSSITEKFGEPTKYFESQSCAFQGLDKVYTYGGVVIRTYPLDEVDYVLNIELKDDTVATAEGVYIGDSKSRVTDVYGEPTTTTDTSVSYTKNGTVLSFIFDGDAVSSIIYSAQAQ